MKGANLGQRFENEVEYRGWNDEMIARHNPSAYYANPLVRILEGFRLRAILSALELCEARLNFLEIGCGFGFVIKKIASRGVFSRAAGLDLSMPSLREAKGRVPGEVLLVEGDGARLPFAPGSFDGILMTEVIEHVPEPVLFLKAAKELLAPGGILVVTAPNEALINRIKVIVKNFGLWRLVFGKYEAADRMDDEWHLHTMDRRMLTNWIIQAGLAVAFERRLPVPLFPMRYLVAVNAVERGE